MSNIDENRRRPKPFGLSSLFSEGCVPKRPFFGNKRIERAFAQETLSPALSHESAAQAPKASKPIRFKSFGIMQLRSKCPRPKPLSLSRLISMAYAPKKPVFENKRIDAIILVFGGSATPGGGHWELGHPPAVSASGKWRARILARPEKSGTCSTDRLTGVDDASKGIPGRLNRCRRLRSGAKRRKFRFHCPARESGA